MTTGRWANAPVGGQAGQEGALGTMHGKSRILATTGGCMLLTGEAVSILFGTLFAGAESTLVQVELDRMWLACQKRSESFRDSSTAGCLFVLVSALPRRR